MLRAHELSFRYPNADWVLRSWSSEFRPGEVVALTGESGVGKSTLLYALGLMLTAQEGAVWVDSVDTAGLSDHQRSAIRARHFGFVFQDAALDPTRSVLDNVTEPATYRGMRREHLVDRAVALLGQMGVKAPPHRRPGQVSGGQAQRIAMCRALLLEPEIILADEPTGNLDTSSASMVLNSLHVAAASGAIVVIATHDPEVIRACHRVEELS